MTILGALTVDPQHVVAWIDTEWYRPDGSPGGHCNKLTVDARAGLVAIGGGQSGFLRHGEAAVLAASNVDDAARRVATVFRQRSASFADNLPDPDDFACTVFAVAGWSAAAGRILLYRFTAASFFTAVLAGRIASPCLDGFATFQPEDDDHLRAMAQRQMADLQSWKPQAGAGDLNIASLTSSGIHLRTLPNFATNGEDPCPSSPASSAS